MMASVDIDGTSIYWYATGIGEPLVLIMGLGCTSAMWFRLEPRLARHHRVILLDNRGMGNSKTEGHLHSVYEMASDLAKVLDAAGEESAHIFGFSMGGMIAQEFALTHPGRVRSLILGCTNCGGTEAVRPEREVLDLLFTRVDMSPEESLRVMVPYTYDIATPRTLIEEDIRVRLASYPSRHGYVAQLYGMMNWSSHARLGRMRVPTLIVHGASDRLVPPENGEILANAIPSSQLVVFDQASHMFQTDQSQQTETTISDFLSAIAHT